MFSVLYGIASPSNVQVVCNKLLQQLHITVDKFWKAELVTMATDLISRYASAKKGHTQLSFYNKLFSEPFIPNPSD